jgi:hypothetical protein
MTRRRAAPRLSDEQREPYKLACLPDPLEDEVHKSVVRALLIFIGEPGVANRLGVMWFSVEHRNAAESPLDKALGLKPGTIEGRRRKERGVVAGTLDTIVHWMGSDGIGRSLWVEIKTRTGGVSPAQKRMRQELLLCGIPSEVARDADEYLAALTKHGVPLLAKVSA